MKFIILLSLRQSLYEAWDHFKKLLRRCPHHDIEIWEQIHIFYNSIYFVTRVMFCKWDIHEEIIP